MALENVSRKNYKKYIIALWVLTGLAVLATLALFILISFTQLPNTAELENPKFEESTLIYTTDGEELGRYFTKNRQRVTYEDLSPHLVNALLATEDERFHQHSGIDFRGTMRAILFMGRRGGASTISQQLAKLFFTQKSRNFVRRIWQKMQEWVIAIEFEKRYTKEEIIAMYLNKYDFLYDAIGVGSAANIYFGKNQKNLTIDEAALLVGMLKNPSLYNPQRYEENTIHRRMIVLKQMEKKHMISNEQYHKLRNQPIDHSRFKRPVHYDGMAPYFRNELTKKLNRLIRNGSVAKNPDGTTYNIYRDGLKIYTTIDSRYQKHAEEAVHRHMKQLQAVYFNRWKGLDPWKYEATDQQLKIRQEALNNLVESSDRYHLLRSAYLNKVIKEISQEIESVRLWNADIRRMLKAEKDDYALSYMNSEGIISNKQKKVYEKIIAHPKWRELKKQWSALIKRTKKDFNVKQPMKVFSHDGGEKEVYMTPLDSLKYHRMHMQLGSIAIEPQTGYVKSWVGGIDYKYFKYDHVTTNRQVGSTFKPFLYTAALMDGYSPCWPVQDVQYTIPAGDPDFGLQDSWSPSNASGEFSEQYFTLKDALKKSLNSVSIWLVSKFGSVDDIIQIATNMGIDENKLPRVPSLVLGVPSLTVLEMTSAYSTFSNNGIHTKPTFIQRIEDKNGNVIYESKIEQNRALSTEYNYAMVELLKYASSSVRFALLTDFGGKTGTTDDYVDGWYVGITPNLTVGTWVGGDDPWVRFLTLEDGQGGVMARPYFLSFMQSLEKDKALNFNTNATFIFPGNLGIELDCSKYPLPKADSTRTDVEHLDDPFEELFEEEINE